MGISYMSCNNCGKTFPDCGGYMYCENCGRRWCSYDCANEDGYQEIYDENEELISDSCNYCRGENYEDYELLDFALSLLKLDRIELIEKYKETVNE